MMEHQRTSPTVSVIRYAEKQTHVDDAEVQNILKCIFFFTLRQSTSFSERQFTVLYFSKLMQP